MMRLDLSPARTRALAVHLQDLPLGSVMARNANQMLLVAVKNENLWLSLSEWRTKKGKKIRVLCGSYDAWVVDNEGKTARLSLNYCWCMCGSDLPILQNHIGLGIIYCNCGLTWYGMLEFYEFFLELRLRTPSVLVCT